MNTAMTKEGLERILDEAVQDVTERTAGVRLHQGDQSTGLLYRMASNSFHEERVSPEDLEEFSKEYFNVLCGRIARAMFQATKVPAHFGPPVFYRGRYEPEGREIQFILTYSDEHYGGAQFIHHVPCSGGDGAVSGEDREKGA